MNRYGYLWLVGGGGAFYSELSIQRQSPIHPCGYWRGNSMWLGEVREPSYENYADGEGQMPSVFRCYREF